MLRYVQLLRTMRCVSLISALAVCAVPLAAQEAAKVIELNGQVFRSPG